MSQARLLVDKGRSAEAAVQLEAHLREHPRAVPERRMLIRVYASMGQMALAEEQARALAEVLGAS
ncbi:MAG TPA: hypothetical protein VGO08_18065, partial [Burkholderiales bacterium]|nr:hypothetical protein [Burkholderiales bacterium]